LRSPFLISSNGGRREVDDRVYQIHRYRSKSDRIRNRSFANVNSLENRWISRRSKKLAILILLPVIVYIASVSVCWTWYQVLRPTDGFWFQCCGHDGILPNLVLGISVVLAVIFLLLTPVSLLLDWRKWKKNNA
jgi:hypothetical protein